MYKKSPTLFVLAAALAGGTVCAADITGKWVATVGQGQITFQLKADGERLTGTLDNGAQPGVVEIKSGTIKGDLITFHIVRTLNNAETRVEWTGQLTGDELKLKRGAAGGAAASEGVAKRAAP